MPTPSSPQKNLETLFALKLFLLPKNNSKLFLKGFIADSTPPWLGLQEGIKST